MSRDSRNNLDEARIQDANSAFRNLTIQDREKILKDPSPSDDDDTLTAQAKAEVRAERKK